MFSDLKREIDFELRKVREEHAKVLRNKLQSIERIARFSKIRPDRRLSDLHRWEIMSARRLDFNAAEGCRVQSVRTMRLKEREENLREAISSRLAENLHRKQLNRDERIIMNKFESRRNSIILYERKRLSEIERKARFV